MWSYQVNDCLNSEDKTIYYNGEYIDQIFVSTDQSAHNINPNSSECGYRNDNYSEALCI